MFKLENFENELMQAMSNKLTSNQNENQFSLSKLASAAEHLNIAAEIFEDVGMTKQAEVIVNLLEKIAHTHKESFFCEKCDEPKEECVCNVSLEEDECQGCGKYVDDCTCLETSVEPKFASVESLKKIKKDLKDSKLSPKELSSLKKMIEQMEESKDSNHLSSSKKKVDNSKLSKNLKETGTLFSKKEYK